MEDLAPEEIATVTFSMTFTNPNQVVEHEAVIDNLMVDKEDRYRLRLLADGVLVMARDFAVVRTMR